jgi:hypothetical protein
MLEGSYPALPNPAFHEFQQDGWTTRALAAKPGWLFGQRFVFLLVLVFAVLAAAAVLSIPAAAIDRGRARGAGPEGATQEGSSWRTLVGCRPLMVFAGCAALYAMQGSWLSSTLPIMSA